MDFFDELGRRISDTADAIGRKTNEVVEVQRLKNQMHAAQKETDRNLMALGKLVYKKYEAGEVMAAEYSSLCEDVVKMQEAIQEYKKQIARVKGMPKCKNCQSYIAVNTEFCTQCGAKVEKEL